MKLTWTKIEVNSPQSSLPWRMAALFCAKRNKVGCPNIPFTVMNIMTFSVIRDKVNFACRNLSGEISMAMSLILPLKQDYWRQSHLVKLNKANIHQKPLAYENLDNPIRKIRFYYQKKSPFDIWR